MLGVNLRASDSVQIFLGFSKVSKPQFLVASWKFECQGFLDTPTAPPHPTPPFKRYWMQCFLISKHPKALQILRTFVEFCDQMIYAVFCPAPWIFTLVLPCRFSPLPRPTPPPILDRSQSLFYFVPHRQVGSSTSLPLTVKWYRLNGRANDKIDKFNVNKIEFLPMLHHT